MVDEDNSIIIRKLFGVLNKYAKLILTPRNVHARIHFLAVTTTVESELAAFRSFAVGARREKISHCGILYRTTYSSYR